MEQMFNPNDVKVRYDRKQNKLYITIKSKCTGTWEKDDYAEKLISDFRQIVYREKEVDGKTVYEYKHRVDIYVPDENNELYFVADLKDVSSIFGGEIEEGKMFSMNELLKLEIALRERQDEIVKALAEKNQNNQKTNG